MYRSGDYGSRDELQGCIDWGYGKSCIATQAVSAFTGEVKLWIWSQRMLALLVWLS